MGYEILPLFSVAGIVFNVIAFRKGALPGCLGLVVGLFGAFATAFGSWPIGLVILIGLGVLAFVPKTAKEGYAADGGLTDYQRRTGPGVQGGRLVDGIRGGVTTDPTQFRATYSYDYAPSTTAVPTVSTVTAAHEVHQKSVGNIEDAVQQIEEDFIQGRIDRDTYVMRRRALLD